MTRVLPALCLSALVMPALVMPALVMPALAQAQGDSNIGLTQYPAPACRKPQPVTLPAPNPPPGDLTETQAIGYNKQVQAYNAAMRAHNEQIGAFTACINTYIANGNADMRRIRDSLDAAVADAAR